MTDSLLAELKEEVEKCISCGFCEAVCPTLPSSGFNSWKGARGRVIMGKELLSAVSSQSERNLADSFYSCLDCHACLYVCPAGVNAGKISQLSREVIVSTHNGGKEKAIARMISTLTEKKQNPLGMKKRSSMWAKSLIFDTDSDTLLFTGNMYQLMSFTKGLNKTRNFLGKALSDFFARMVTLIPSFSILFMMRNNRKMEKRYSNSLRNIVKLLQMAGIKFSYLGEKEPYPGTFLHDLGYIEEFRKYANHVARLFRESGIRTIITVDPHTHEILRKEYPRYVENFDFTIIYYLDLLKNIDFERSEESVVFHEPCHFALREDSYDLPITILREVSNLTMPSRSGRKVECCGGPDELLFPEIAEGVSNRRHRDLVNTGAGTLVTACPICFANLDKGTKILDIADYLVERIH